MITLKTIRRRVASVFTLAMFGLLTGCEWQLFDPKGPVAEEIKWLIIGSAAIMMLVVVPVTIMGVWFPWRYRKGNTDQPYEPEWEHSNKIEAVVWAIPITIILILGTITYYTSHSLDPRKPLVSDKKPMVVQVVALNWKWLFIYPDLNVASINELAMPKDQPVEFLITSDSVMNSFFIPRLGSQIYAMSGMENRLNLMGTVAGTYEGLSANYSGFGYSGMHFDAIVTEDDAAFDAWIEQVRKQGNPLDNHRYVELTEKSRDVPVQYFTLENPLLFTDIVNQYAGSLGQPKQALAKSEITDLKKSSLLKAKKTSEEEH